MPERIKEFLNRILEWFKGISLKQRIAIFSVLGSLILALVILGVVVSRPNMRDLLVCDDAAQAAEIKDILDGDATINYYIDDNLVVKVEASDLVAAELLLGSNNIPTKGYSLEDATSGGFSSTEADKQRLYQKYLEDKFADRLSQFDYVKTATVDITLPKDDGLLIHDQEEGTASVTLELKDSLSDEQAYGIARFVATQLGNKSTTGITIIDSNAKILYSGADADSVTGLATSQLSFKSKQEQMIKGQLENTLKESGVFSNIEIGLNLDMNFDHTETANRKYSYPDGQDHAFTSEEALYESTAKNGAAATPGTDSNDGTQYMTEDNQYSEQTISDTDRKYLHNEELTKTESNGGKINYETSSVSVVATRYIVYDQKVLEDTGALDDTTWEQYKIDHGDTVKVEEVDEELRGVVANATGFADANISLMIYEQPSFIDKDKSNISLTDIFQILLAVLIFALLGFVVFRSMKTQKEAEPEPELSVESLLESTAEAADPLEDIGYSEKSETRLLIEKFVEEKPEAAALLLRNWLNEDWE